MSKLTESAIEDFAIKLFERLAIATFTPPILPPMATAQNVAVMMK